MATSPTDPLVGIAHRDSAYQQQRFRLLPELNRFFLTHSDIQEAFPGICRRLQRAVPHLYAGLTLYDPVAGHLHLHAQNPPSGESALPLGFIFPLEGTPAGEAFRLRRPVTVDDLRSPQLSSETTREQIGRAHV